MMKVVMLLPFAVLLGGTARAAELDTLTNKLRKYDGFRGVCVCQDGGPNHGRAGYTASFPIPLAPGNRVIGTSCSIYEYTAAGLTLGASSCHPFVVLAK